LTGVTGSGEGVDTLAVLRLSPPFEVEVDVRDDVTVDPPAVTVVGTVTVVAPVPTLPVAVTPERAAPLGARDR